MRPLQLWYLNYAVLMKLPELGCFNNCWTMRLPQKGYHWGNHKIMFSLGNAAWRHQYHCKLIRKGKYSMRLLFHNTKSIFLYVLRLMYCAILFHNIIQILSLPYLETLFDCPIKINFVRTDQCFSLISQYWNVSIQPAFNFKNYTFMF